MSDDERMRRAMAILVEIVRQSQADKVEGKTRLFKAFYHAHLYHAGRTARLLSDWPIVHMPQGPGIDRFNQLLDKLCEEQFIKLESMTIGPFKSTAYRWTGKDLGEDSLDEEELESVRQAVEFISSRTARDLSEITHLSHSWQSTEDGEEMDIFQDVMSDEEFDEWKERARRVKGEFEQAWR